jgi:hypothetical protein
LVFLPEVNRTDISKRAPAVSAGVLLLRDATMAGKTVSKPSRQRSRPGKLSRESFIDDR